MSERVAITGVAGQLGQQLARAFSSAGDEILGLGRPQFDLADPSKVAPLADWKPTIVVNSAAWTDVDACALDPQQAMAINGDGAGRVAEAGAHAGALVVQISTNEVFDGSSSAPYAEDDPPTPINAYGASKLAGERAVAEAASRHLIVRTAWLFGPAGGGFPGKIAKAASRAARHGERLRVVNDEWGNPTWTPALADAVVAAVKLAQRDAAPPILHLAGEPPTSRFGWAERVLAQLELRPELKAISSSEYQRASKVPLRAVLATRLAASLGIGPLAWESQLSIALNSVRSSIA